jgi:cytochrome c oxidase cbb3-type subunit 3
MSSERDDAPQDIPELPRGDEAARDGIVEEDNPIPLWFNVTFIASIVFALVYTPYYIFSGWSQIGQYEAESARLEESFAAVRATLPSANPFRGDTAAITEGQGTWGTICVACHLADGRGMVGPSLIDPYWKYGTDDESLFQTVSEGRPGGMSPWGAQLSSEDIWKVLAYMETLPKSDAPGVGAPDYTAPAPGG